jgi:hypothetical protein
VLSVGQALPTGNSALTAGGLVSQHKRDDHRESAHPMALKAMTANAPKAGSHPRLGPATLLEHASRSSTALALGQASFPVVAVSAHRKRALKVKAGEARTILLEHGAARLAAHFEDVDFSKAGLQARHYRAQENDPEGYVSLVDLLEYLYENEGEM